ncbi:MAG: 50S ribosomal protein L23 [Alphaproteobacteria bacterium]
MQKQLPYALFDLIQKPLVTEKGSGAAAHNQVFFLVRPEATKPAIKQAVEHVFNVKVKAVNTLVTKGKKKRFRGRFGQQSDFKKAMVTLVEGHHIDLSSGV